MSYLRPARKFILGSFAVAFISFGILGGCYGLILHAQQQPQGLTPPPKSTTPKTSATDNANTFDGAPFVVGERLVYSVSWGGFGTAARIESEVAERGQFFGHESYQIRTKVETIGQVRSLFGDLDNQYTSYLSLNTSLPHRVVTSIRQGQAQAEEVVVLDQSKKQAIFSDDSTVDLSAETYDLTSLAYGLRLRNWNEGSKQRFSVLYGKEVVEVDAEVKGRERLQTQSGAYNTILVRLTPRKRYVKYRTRVWLSDDAKRLPVLIVAKVAGGEARAELASATSSFRPTAPLAKGDPLKDESGAPRIIAVGPTGGNNPATGGNPGEPANGSNSSDGTKATEGEAANNPRPERSYPFVVGERLNYDISWGNFASVGKASFEVRRQGTLGPNRVFEFFGEATSTGVARQLINVSDQMSSFAMVESLVPVRSDLRLREGKRFKQTTATYDWSQGKVRLSSGTQTDVPAGTLDLISLFYAVRASELKVGATFNYLFLDANHRLQTVTIRVSKQEAINSALGSLDALQLDVLAPEPAKLLLAQVWVSNDSRRLPLYLVTRTRFGELRFQLTNAVNTK
jgi:hypothetical protein